MPGQNDAVQIDSTHVVNVTNFTYRNAKTTVVEGAQLVLNQGIEHEFTNPAAFPDVSGVLEIGAGGYLTGNGPQYQIGSELRYGSGGVYDRSIEWGWGADIYKPYHVSIKSGTSLNLGANGAVDQELEVRGNLTVEVNGNLYMDYGTDQMNQPLFVKGNTTVNGQLMLSNNAGGDIKINGDFTFGTSGRFFPKARLVIFTGLNGSIHNVTNDNTAVNPFVIPYLVYQPTSGATTVNLLGATNYHISAPNGGAVIRHASGSSSRLSIGARKLTIGTSGVENYIQYLGAEKGTTYLLGGASSDLELLGNGELGILNFISSGRILNNFTINRNAPGEVSATLETSLTVNNILGLQNGVIKLGNKVVFTLANNAAVIPDGGSTQAFISVDGDYTTGVFRRRLNISNSAYSFKFPVGDDKNSPHGLQYSPITVSLKKTNSTSSSYIDVQTFDENAVTDADTNYLSRYWRMVMSGITNPGYSATAKYYDTDVVGTENSLKNYVFKSDENEWIQVGGNVDAGNNLVNFNKSEGYSYSVAPAPATYHLITAAEKAKKREINVRGNGMNIESGDATPQIYDNTDFGTTSAGNTVTKTFRIENLGTQNLQIGGIAVQTSDGTAASSDFQLLSASSYTIPGGGFVDIQIRFNAIGLPGLKTAKVFIDNNDPNEADYNYIIQGTIQEFVGCSGFRILGIQNFESFPPVPEVPYTVSEQITDASHIVSGGNGWVGFVQQNKYLGDRSLQVFNAHSIVEFSPVDLTGTIAPYLSLDLAALGYSPNRGPASGDYILVSISPDGGTSWDEQFRLSPGTVSFWGFESLSAEFSRAYSTAPYTNIVTNSITTGHRYYITGLPRVASLKVKIELRSNDLQRIWALDNVIYLDDTTRKTWNGTAWTGVDALPPTFSQKAIIDGNLTTTPATSFSTCECEVKSGKTLTIGANSYVEVQGNITNNGEIIVKSDGNLKQVNKDAVNTNDIKVRREFSWSSDPLPPTSPRREYNYLSSPVALLATFNMKHIFGNDPLNVPFVTVLREPTNSFVNAVLSDYDIPAKGFAVREARKAYSGVPLEGIASNEAQFKGKPNNGDIILPLSYTPGRGYNLAGNPYPSNVDINAVYNDPDTKNIHPEFRFWDNKVNATYVQMGGAYQGYSYAIFNAETEPNVGYGIHAPGNDKGGPEGTKIPGSIIKVSQGFIVRANADGAQLSFKNSMRRTTNAGTVFFGKESPRNRYRLQLVKSDGFTIQNAVSYFETGSLGLGKEDTRLPNSAASDALFTYADDAKVVINGRSSFTPEDVLTLGLRHFTAGTYTIQTVDEEGVFANGQAIYLKDKQLGIVTDLTKGDYTFTSDSGEYTNRFEIVYAPTLVLATDTAVKGQIEVFRDASDFVIRSSEQLISRVEVYDASGRLVISALGSDHVLRFSADRLQEGMYFVKTDLKEGGQVTKKIRK